MELKDLKEALDIVDMFDSMNRTGGVGVDNGKQMTLDLKRGDLDYKFITNKKDNSYLSKKVDELLKPKIEAFLKELEEAVRMDLADELVTKSEEILKPLGVKEETEIQTVNNSDNGEGSMA